jgi:four helix bundle protein
MSADLSLVQQAGADAPAVSVPVVRARPGAELALALTASDAEQAAASVPAHVLDAEKLTVYHVALELQCMANTLVPSVNRVLRDQFERASLSVVLNLAEGCGRVSRRQRRYHFGIARGSATECAALTDVLRLRRLTPASECFRARSLAVRCVQMTTKLIEAMGPLEPKGEAAA